MYPNKDAYSRTRVLLDRHRGNAWRSRWARHSDWTCPRSARNILGGAPPSSMARHGSAIAAENVFGALAPTQAMLPLLRNSKSRRIVNVSSRLGSLTLNPDPPWIYASVKRLRYNGRPSQMVRQLHCTTLGRSRRWDRGFFRSDGSRPWWPGIWLVPPETPDI